MILDTSKLNDLIENKKSILKKKPYPHANPQGLIKGDFFKNLMENTPSSDEEISGGVFNNTPYGIKSHIKYEERNKIKLPDIWQEFLYELENGGEYKEFISEFIKRKDWHLEYEWSYLWKQSLHVHPDSERKLFTHLFYLLDETNWNEDWGGQTTVFFKPKFGKNKSNKFEDYKKTWNPKIVGNYSFFFVKSEKSFHGILPYSTENHGKNLRKTFFPIATLNE